MPREQAMQLVAIEIADALRRIEQRPRPTRRRGIDLAQRLAAILRIGGDHDRDVMIGQRRRQFGLAEPHRASSVRRRTPRAGIRSACCCPCRLPPPAQERAAADCLQRRASGTADGTRAPPAEWQDRPPCRPAAARSTTGRAPRPPPQCRRAAWPISSRPNRAKILAVERHLRKPGHADAVGATDTGWRQNSSRDSRQHRQLHEFRPVMREQQLDLRDDPCDAIELALQVLLTRCLHRPTTSR